MPKVKYLYTIQAKAPSGQFQSAIGEKDKNIRISRDFLYEMIEWLFTEGYYENYG